MNRIRNSTIERIPRRGLFLVACIISLAMQPFTTRAAVAATTLPVLWTAGGLSAGSDSAGPAARMAVDAWGNIAIVSGPAGGSLLAVTSYTPDGLLRWRSTIAPISGTFGGSWVVAAPNGDVVALGIQSGTGGMVAVTLVRFDFYGTFQFRVDTNSGGIVRSVGRLVVDGQGNAYLPFNSILHKYSPSGVLLWETPTSVRDGGTALSPDGADVVVTGAIGGNWRTAAFDTATGAPNWLVVAPEGIATTDLVVDQTRVYVTGQGVTGANTPAIAYSLTVVAYDRATGARLWRTDSRPGSLTGAAGLRMALAPDGNLVAAGQASVSGCLSWWTVALNATNGAVRWQALRDTTPLCLDEVPAVVFVLPDGTTVVSGTGGPPVVVMGSSYLRGATVGYSPNGTVLWEAFSPAATVWAAALPSGDVCATGGADALITCFAVSAPASPPAAPSGLTARFAGGSILLAWQDNATDETAFSVERSVFTGTGWTSFVVLATLGANATSYADTSFTSSNLNYRVRASNAGGDSAYSNTAAIIIVSANDPPTAIMSATPSSGTAPLTVTFDGSGSTDSFGGFVTSWAWAFGDGTTGTGVTTTHAYSTPGTYVATLTVTDNGHLSSTTSTSIAVTAPPLPGAPANLTAAALSRSSIGLTWTNTTTNQTEVRIERCKGSGCRNFAQVAVVAGTATAFTDVGLASRTTYRYRVRAHNVTGDSAYSNTASAQTRR